MKNNLRVLLILITVALISESARCATGVVTTPTPIIPKPASSTKTIYLAARTDGVAGDGSESNPYDVSTAAKLDAFFAKQLATSNGSGQAQFNLAAGHYSTTDGIPLLSGQRLIGAGQGATIITATPVLGPDNMFTGFCVVYSYKNLVNNQLSDVQIGNLTLDGGVRATAAPLAAAFTVPQTGRRVTVTVKGGTPYLGLGANVYVQDMANTHGVQQWWGVLTVKAIRGNQITLENTGDGVAGKILATAALFPVAGRSGLFITGTNVKVQSITVQDTAIPVYEGCVGIFVTDNFGYIALNNVISNCTVKDVFGFYGSCIAAGSFNNHYSSTTGSTMAGSRVINVASTADMTVGYNIAATGIPINSTITAISSARQAVISSPATASGSNVTFAYGSPGAQSTYGQLSITNNTVVSNGSYAGIGLAGDYNCMISGNTISGANTGLFCDTGFNSGNVIVNNSFSGQKGIHIGVGAPAMFQNSIISNNVIRTSAYPLGGVEIGGNAVNVEAVGNTVESLLSN